MCVVLSASHVPVTETSFTTNCSTSFNDGDKKLKKVNNFIPKSAKVAS